MLLHLPEIWLGCPLTSMLNEMILYIEFAHVELDLHAFIRLEAPRSLEGSAAVPFAWRDSNGVV